MPRFEGSGVLWFRFAVHRRRPVNPNRGTVEPAKPRNHRLTPTVLVLFQEIPQPLDRQRVNRAAVGGDIRRTQQRVVDGLFGGVQHRLEQRGHRVGAEHRACRHAVCVRHPLRRVRRKRDREVAAAVRVGRARARKREDASRRQPLEIARVNRRVGGNDHHARSVRRRSSASAGRREMLPHRHAGDREPPSVVRLHEHADRPLVGADAQPA